MNVLSDSCGNRDERQTHSFERAFAYYLMLLLSD